MKRRCPTLTCSPSSNPCLHHPKSKPIIRKGTFYRARDRRKITRYHCKLCKRNFSSATFDQNYRQKKRDLNPIIDALLCSSLSQRRLALLLKINRKTVVRKFIILAEQADRDHQTWQSQLNPDTLTEIQFDDLETSEHTKCKPISVSLAVNKNTREIIAFQTSRMPARGHLAAISRLKYGYRKDDRPQGWKALFKTLKPLVSEQAVFESDENPHYPKHLREYFKKAFHTQFKGARGAVAGQGELKKLRFDPLFSLNHTCAMLRANLNRLVRKTWCTTKTIEGLNRHLALYVRFHNQVLIPHSGTAKGGS